jgi:hypothetical protein
MTRYLSSKVVLVGLTAVGLSVICQAQTPNIIYDNTIDYQGQIFYTENEFGDQIKFSTALTERVITSIKFEYYLASGASGDETAQLRLYRNDGSAGEPEYLLYDTGAFSISSGASGFNYVTLDDLALSVQDGLTWTVLFGGVSSTETAGLLVYGTPTVGTSFDDFWEKSGGVWGTKTFPTVVANFGAQIMAIPEPATVQLMILGGLVGLGCFWRRNSR